MRLTSTALAALALGLSASPALADDPETYFEGETIRVIIPFSAGGGTDTFGRYISQYLGDHIPGNPTVVAENVTGAGGLMGANEYANAVDHDGYTLFTASGHMNLRMFLGLADLELALDGLEPIVAGPMGHVTAIQADLIDQPEDIAELDSITKGVTDPVGLVEALLAVEAFGIDYNAIPGYDGRGDTRVAFERGELDITTQGTPPYLANVMPLVEEGSAKTLWAIGFTDADGNPVRDPAVPDIPTMPEVYESIHGELPSGEAWEAYQVAANLVQNTRGTMWVHNDAPEAAREALHMGVASMVEDEEFLAAGEEVLAGYEIMHGDGLGEVSRVMDEAPEEVLDWMRDFLTEEFGVEFDR